MTDVPVELDLGEGREVLEVREAWPAFTRHDALHVAREVSPGGVEKPELSDLRAMLELDAGPVSELGEAQRSEKAAALRQPDVDQIARARFDRFLRLAEAAR